MSRYFIFVILPLFDQNIATKAQYCNISKTSRNQQNIATKAHYCSISKTSRNQQNIATKAQYCNISKTSRNQQNIATKAHYCNIELVEFIFSMKRTENFHSLHMCCTEQQNWSSCIFSLSGSSNTISICWKNASVVPSLRKHPSGRGYLKIKLII